MGHPAVHFEADFLFYLFSFAFLAGPCLWTHGLMDTVERKTNVPLMMMMMDMEMMNVAEKFIVHEG